MTSAKPRQADGESAPERPIASTGQAAQFTAAAGDRRLMRFATYASVSVAATLIVAKAAAWWLTGSVAVLSSTIDSALDVIASLINLFAVTHALSPADREHRFGHGKAEALAGLAQSAFIAGSAGFLLYHAGERLLQPQPVVRGDVGIAVIVLSLVLTLGLVLFQRMVVRRTGSVAISADSLHYKGDLLANLAVIAALVASQYLGWHYADPLLAIAIAGYILYGTWQILRVSLNQLMDRELPDAERQRIRTIVMRHPRVLAMHDLRTRASGPNAFMQLHLELDADMTLLEAHEISDQVEAQLLESYPGAEVIIHQDPAGVEEEHSRLRR